MFFENWVGVTTKTMFTVKRLAPMWTHCVFEDTEHGSENRNEAIAQALNLASKDAKEYRARIRATTNYEGHIAFIIENSKTRFGGYAVSSKEDKS